MSIELSEEQFGILSICAIRYCHGRRTYMPSLVQRIVGTHLSELSDKDIGVMVDDCQFQRRFDLYGDDCDKVDWLKWEERVIAESKRRKEE